METTIEKGNIRLEIKCDTDPQNPRSLDYTDCNVTKMICFSNQYDLGDKHDYNFHDYNGWDEMEKDIIKNENPLVILPLYLYSHSGITMSTTPFSCNWDSGQIGFIIVTKKNMRDIYLIKRCTKKWYDKAIKDIECELNVYDQYIRNEVYGYEVYEDDDVIDSCWGFYGDEFWGYMSDNIDSDIIEILRPELEKEFGVETKF